MKQVVKRVILGKEDVERLLRDGPGLCCPPEVLAYCPLFFDSEASSTSTLVEIVAEDRPGLFYDLARTFYAAGCSIEVVLIDTEAHKAIDVFYVTHNQAKLPPSLQAELQQALLGVCQAQ